MLFQIFASRTLTDHQTYGRSRGTKFTPDCQRSKNVSTFLFFNMCTPRTLDIQRRSKPRRKAATKRIPCRTVAYTQQEGATVCNEYTCIHTYIYIYTSTRIHIYVYVCVYIYVFTLFTYVYIYICIYMHIHTYVYIYI